MKVDSHLQSVDRVKLVLSSFFFLYLKNLNSYTLYVFLISLQISIQVMLDLIEVQPPLCTQKIVLG